MRKCDLDLMTLKSIGSWPISTPNLKNCRPKCFLVIGRLSVKWSRSRRPWPFDPRINRAHIQSWSISTANLRTAGQSVLWTRERWRTYGIVTDQLHRGMVPFFKFGYNPFFMFGYNTILVEFGSKRLSWISYCRAARPNLKLWLESNLL
jgi:hypothetical protein